jgi:ABC-type multidrug transport system ATPase subunit
MQAISVGGQDTNIITDYILKILGLDICADTMVGDDMLRGISGGQRKRVTTGIAKILDSLICHDCIILHSSGGSVI